MRTVEGWFYPKTRFCYPICHPGKKKGLRILSIAPALSMADEEITDKWIRIGGNQGLEVEFSAKKPHYRVGEPIKFKVRKSKSLSESSWFQKQTSEDLASGILKPGITELK